MKSDERELIIRYLTDKGREATLREFNIDDMLLKQVECEVAKSGRTKVFFNDTATFEKCNGSTDKMALWKLHNAMFRTWLRNIMHKDKCILLLKWLGFKQSEIAEVLEETQSAVSQRLQSLKIEYKKYFEI